MNLRSIFRRLRYPEVDRRVMDRRVGCRSFAPTDAELEADRQEQEEMRMRLRHVQNELELIRRRET